MQNTNEFLSESNAIEGVYDDESFEQALVAWKYLLEQKELNDMVIKKAHYLLMKGKLVGKEIGYYRQQPVWIGGKEAVNHLEILDQMDIWFKACKYLPESTYEDKAKEIKTMHIRFEKTHPFVDGNGRIGRMLLNWQRVKLGLSILVIEEDEKQKYYDWFK